MGKEEDRREKYTQAQQGRILREHARRQQAESQRLNTAADRALRHASREQNEISRVDFYRLRLGAALLRRKAMGRVYEAEYAEGGARLADLGAYGVPLNMESDDLSTVPAEDVYAQPLNMGSGDLPVVIPMRQPTDVPPAPPVKPRAGSGRRKRTGYLEDDK